MPLATTQQITEEIRDMYAELKESNYPEDELFYMVDARLALADHEIIDQWVSLPVEHQNRFTEILTDLDPSITIQALMRNDLYLHYDQEYALAYASIDAEQENK